MALFRNKNCGTHPATRGAPRIVRLLLLLLLVACALLAQGCAANRTAEQAVFAGKDAENVAGTVEEAIKNNDAEAAYENLLLAQYHLAVAEEFKNSVKGEDQKKLAPEGALGIADSAYSRAKRAVDEATKSFNKAFPNFDVAAYEAQKAYVTYTDEQVLALLFPDTPIDGTDLDNPTTLAERLDIKTLGDVLGGSGESTPPRPDTVVTITGNLAAMSGGMSANGVYGFNVNLTSGIITNGAMSGGHGSAGTYGLAQGTGTLVGNNFEVKNFQGQVDHNTNVSGSYLQGTAANGFKDVNDAVTGGSFDLIDSSGQSYLNNGPGTITDGSRTQ